MTFDERTAAIGILLRETILPRYRRPEHMNDETARSELADMVADLNAAWPIMPAERFASVGKDLARALRTTYTGRAWPTIAHMARALEAALKAPAPVGVSRFPSRASDRAEWRRSRLLAWCKGKEPCPEFLISRENLTELAKDGEIAFGEIEEMLAFAAGNLGIADDDAPQPAPHSGDGGFRHFRSKRGSNHA